jgi:hypothetical protein
VGEQFDEEIDTIEVAVALMLRLAPGPRARVLDYMTDRFRGSTAPPCAPDLTPRAQALLAKIGADQSLSEAVTR